VGWMDVLGGGWIVVRFRVCGVDIGWDVVDR